MRTPSERQPRNGEGWLHSLIEAERSASRMPAETTRAKPNPDWGTLAQRHGAGITDELVRKLAEQLHVDPVALRELGIGWTGSLFSFPMFGADGSVCGIRTRHPKTGRKLVVAGGHLGIVRRITPSDQRLLICEGETDTAAALTLGEDAIGVPGAGQCFPIVAAYVRNRDVVVVADTDDVGQKAAAKLRDTLLPVARTVRIVTPPAKDLRAWIFNGATRNDLVQLIETAAADRQPGLEPYEGLDADEVMKLPPGDYVVDDIIPEGLVILYGDTQSLKSFVELDLGEHITRGMRFRGHAVAEGPVMLFLGEGSGGFGQRLRAWQIGHPDAPPRRHYLRLFPMVPPLAGAGVGEAAKRLASTFRSMPEAPRLVTIDTLSNATAGVDENDNAALAASLEVVKRLRIEFPTTTFLLLHHIRKAAGIGMEIMRGGTVLRANVDGVIYSERSGSSHTLTVQKLKEGRDGTKLSSELRVVETGQRTRSGKPVTSCFLVSSAPPMNTGLPGAEATQRVRSLLDSAGPEGLTRAMAARELGLSPTQTGELLRKLAGASRSEGTGRVRYWSATHAPQEEGGGQVAEGGGPPPHRHLASDDEREGGGGGASQRPATVTSEGRARSAPRKKLRQRATKVAEVAVPIGGTATSATLPMTLPPTPSVDSTGVDSNSRTISEDDGLPEKPRGRRRTRNGGTR